MEESEGWWVLAGNSDRLDDINHAFRPYLLAHERLLDGRQVLKRTEHEVRVLASAHELAKLAKLLCQREQDLVLVVELVLEEGNELLPRPLRTEGKSNRRQSADRGQAGRNIVRLELICRAGTEASRQDKPSR